MHHARMTRIRKGAPGRANQTKSFHQRCAVRITYSRNAVRGQWRAHGRYVARDSAMRIENPDHAAFNDKADALDIASALTEWQGSGDERMWKVIISPEFGERVDLRKLTRELMARMGRDLGIVPEWAAVTHHNTEHPHVHVALRGVDSNGRSLRLDRDYIKNGIRGIAEDLCTRQLGYRSEKDAAESSAREIREHRFTSLDREISLRRDDQAAAIYVDSLYAGIVTTPGGPLVPVVSGIQVNGVPTNTIVAGTSGYIAIYGTNMTGATTVGLPPGISLSSFAVYNNGTQINAFFMAQVSAGTGSHNITVTTPGGTSATSSASSALTVAITLKSFSFSNGVPYSRDCPGAASPISAPTWPSPTGVTCPQKSPYLGDHAVYASGAVMTGTVNFSVAPAPSQAVPGMYIQGVIPGVGNFTATGVAMAANSTTFSAAVKANAALPSSKTQFYNPMSVAWSVGQSGNSCSSGCVSLGSSSNPVYVTLAPSIVSPKVSPIMLTYVALAVAAGGATTPQTALANTWAKFSTGSGPANVSTWDGRLMFYYVPGVGFNACVTVATLLVETNGIPANNLTSGQCGAFAALLEDSLSINGIASTWLNITSIDGSKMVVKAWTASNISYPSQAPWEYKLLLGTSDYMVPVPIGGFGDLADINGIAGQNSAQPSEKVFDAHFIVQPTVPSAQDYDPSYGVTYATAATFELNSEFGYAKQMNGDTSGHYHVRPAVVAPYAVNVQFTPIAGNSIP